jgi:hypothetical protein
VRRNPVPIGNPPDPAFERILAAAQGFFQLEISNDAWNELEELPPEFRHLSPVIIFRVLILHNLGRWEDAVIAVLIGEKWAILRFCRHRRTRSVL